VGGEGGGHQNKVCHPVFYNDSRRFSASVQTEREREKERACELKKLSFPKPINIKSPPRSSLFKRFQVIITVFFHKKRHKPKLAKYLNEIISFSNLLWACLRSMS